MPSWDHKLLIIRAEDEEHWPFLCLLVTSLYTGDTYYLPQYSPAKGQKDIRSWHFLRIYE